MLPTSIINSFTKKKKRNKSVRLIKKKLSEELSGMTSLKEKKNFSS